MVAQSTDRIEKHIVLRAPRSRVWRALTTPAEFGAWFGAELAGAFRVGEICSGPLTVAGYEHLRLELEVAALEPEHYFAFRWHPHAVDTEVDYSSEPKTLVEFRLSEVAGGTALALVESGFDRLPPRRRATALEMNAGGWAAQVENISRHVAP